jgi:hypothetical protein
MKTSNISQEPARLKMEPPIKDNALFRLNEIALPSMAWLMTHARWDESGYRRKT